MFGHAGCGHADMSHFSACSTENCSGSQLALMAFVVEESSSPNKARQGMLLKWAMMQAQPIYFGCKMSVKWLAAGTGDGGQSGGS